MKPVVALLIGLACVSWCGCGSEPTGDADALPATENDLDVAAPSDLAAPPDLAAADLTTADFATSADLLTFKCVSSADCPGGSTCCSDGTYSACIAGVGTSPCNSFFYGTPTCTSGGQCGVLGTPPNYCCPTENPNVDRCFGFLAGSGSGCFTDIACTPGSCLSSQTCVSGYCRFN